MSRALLGDDAAATSPGFDTLDPSAIVDDTLKISRDTHGFACIRYFLAPGTALPGDALYTLKFRCSTPWRNLPGSSNTEIDGTGFQSMEFAPGAGPPFPVQIVEIDKAGSTAGDWIVFG